MNKPKKSTSGHITEIPPDKVGCGRPAYGPREQAETAKAIRQHNAQEKAAQR